MTVTFVDAGPFMVREASAGPAPRCGPATGLQSDAVGTRLNSRSARSTPTTAPLSSRVKKPRCPFRPPLVTMYSSASPGSSPRSAGAQRAARPPGPKVPLPSLVRLRQRCTRAARRLLSSRGLRPARGHRLARERAAAPSSRKAHGQASRTCQPGAAEAAEPRSGRNRQVVRNSSRSGVISTLNPGRLEQGRLGHHRPSHWILARTHSHQHADHVARSHAANADPFPTRRTHVARQTQPARARHATSPAWGTRSGGR